jgi:thioredoxin reductase
MSTSDRFDVAIVGGGPAGLSAALILGRCRRRVIVIDHGKPRNAAALQVNGYLGLNGRDPAGFREMARDHAQAFGTEFFNGEVDAIACCDESACRFRITTTDNKTFYARKLLLATGTRDILPDIENVDLLYGKSVHHCPYCDGWEHRDEHLVALGDGPAGMELALSLTTWSKRVTACTNGQSLSLKDQDLLSRNEILYRPEAPIRLEMKSEDQLRAIVFASGPTLQCDALFFHTEQGQRSKLPEMLGCKVDDRGLLKTETKQGTGIQGLFLAGDADGDVQFAIVAAAEGAIAATAINRELQDEGNHQQEPC